MKKFAIILLTILIAGLFVACNQEVTIDAQTYANMELGTFVLNGQNYATLQAAIDALSSKAVGDNDGVIYLTRDFSGPGAVIEGKNVKIDFGANKYTFTNVTATQGSTSGTFGLKIKGGSSVTLAGTKSMDLFDSTTGLTMVYVEGAGTSLAVEQAPQMSVADDQFVFWAADGATLTIGGETTLTGGLAATGTAEKTPLVSINDGAKADVSNMKLESAKVIPNSTKALKVSTLESSGESKIINSGSGDVTVTKSEGTVVVQNTGGGTVKVDGSTISEGQAKEIEDGEETTTEVTVSVAMIGTKEYTSIEGAIDGAADGQTITILNDIESLTVTMAANKTFFVDLNGKNISNLNADGITAGKVTIQGNGDVTITTTTTGPDPEHLVLQGGSYNLDVELWADEGYDAVCKEDGKYHIRKMPLEVSYISENKTVTVSLNKFAKTVNAGVDFSGITVTQLADVDLTGIVWTPIGAGGYRVISPTSPFSGTFDGNNYEIKGLSSKGYNPPATIEYKEGKEGRYSYGLFGYVKDSTIMNVILSDVDIDVATGDSIGALIGYSSGKLTVDNCDVISGSVTGYDAVAGVVGRAYGNVDNTIISIEKSSNSAKITGSEKVAGIVGYVAGNAKPYTASIDNNVNNGEVHGYGSVSFVSGIVNYGYWNGAKDTVIITNNANNGLIKQDTAHNIAYIANGASDGPEESIDIYDFRGNTNSGNNEIENLKDVDWYKNKEHEVVLVINGQRPIVYYEHPTVYTEPSGTGINYGESNGRHCEEVIVSNGTETLKFSLDGFAAKVNSGTTFEDYTATLKEDIALYTRWTPIGNSARKTADKYFAGTFDGNNKTITGLTLSAVTNDLKYDANQTDDSAPGIYFNEYIFGLFGVVKNATIKNLTLANVSIVNLYREIDATHRLTGENVGALIGYSEGNLHVTGVTVSSGSVAAGSNVAGIIGRAYGNGGTAIVIENCTNNADITATNGSGNKAKAAGIVGFINTNGCPSASITGCSNTGAISSTATGHVIASGIANYGFQASSGNTEKITITGTNSGTVTVSQGAALTSTDSIAALCSYMNAEDTISINPSNN